MALEPPQKRRRSTGSSDGDVASSQGSNLKDNSFHSAFIKQIANGRATAVVDSPDGGNRTGHYIVSMTEENPNPVAEKWEPVKDGRVPRFFRKLGHENFLQVKMKMPARFQLPKRLKRFHYLGRCWQFLYGMKPKKKGRHDKEADKRHSFIFVSCPKLSADSVRRLHIRQKLALPGPGSPERSCEKHFFCRSLAQNCQEPRPEEQLLRDNKYTARFKLGWTDAIPTCVIDPEHILEKPDLTGSNGCVLSDGCGRIGLGLAKKVQEELKETHGLNYIPAVFQARLGPCKGLWVVDLDLDEDVIEIRKSQAKWDFNWHDHLGDAEDRRFEVKAWSKFQATEGQFNVQLVPILEAGGVPAEFLLQFAQEELAEIASVLGGSAADMARCLPTYDAADRNKTQISIQMIDAGVDFRSEPAAFKWCTGYVLGKVKKPLLEEKHYRCPESWRGFIIPDFSQKLEPHEAIFKISDSKGFLEGEALVARNPCTAPWDVQKFKFLGHADILRRFGSLGPSFLHNGVVVLSASPNCTRAPADFLAGGDYDGDSVIVIGHKSIVDSFDPYPVHEVATAEDETDRLINGIVEEEAARRAKEREKEAEPPRKPEGVHESLCEEHWLSAENSQLTAQSADWWTAIADEMGVRHPAAVKLGLIHQKALDSKIPFDKVQRSKFLQEVSSRLRVPPPEDALMPHWHPRTSNGVQQSTSILGRLQNVVVPDNLTSTWKKEYGGKVYQDFFNDVPPSDKPPTSLLWDGFGAWMQEAQEHLQEYLRKRDLVDWSKPSEFDLLKAHCRERFLHAKNFSEKLAYATAFYHVQYRHFCSESLQKKVNSEEQLERLLLPAWELFTQELCFVHIQSTAPSGNICLMCQESRGRVQYRHDNSSKPHYVEVEDR